MSKLRSWAEAEALDPPLSEAETALRAASEAGEPCVVNGGKLPDAVENPSLTIRAELLRLAIEAQSPQNAGLDLRGAFITGSANLDFLHVAGPVRMQYCRFEKILSMRQARFELLNLSRSVFSGINAQGVTVSGNAILRGCVSDDKVSFSGAAIGRQFTANAARLTSPDDFALNLQGAIVQGPVFLHPVLPEEQEKITTPFTAEGCVSFSRAQLGALYAEKIHLTATRDSDVLRAPNMIVKGDVRLCGAQVEGEVKLEGSRIEGNLDCRKARFSNPLEKGHAFNAQRVRVDQVFVWKDMQGMDPDDNDTGRTGIVSLTGAHVGELDDAPKNWPDKEDFLMDGLTYDRIKGKVSTPPERRKWLENGSYFEGEFRPQPMTHYAKFLQATGHDAQARSVLMRRETLVREFERTEFRGLKWFVRVVSDRAQLWTVGYGHDPRRALFWLIGLIFLTAAPAYLAYWEGSMAPNSAPVLNSQEWKDVAAKPHLHLPNPAEEWSKSVPGRDWETFSAFAYGLDVVIPIIDFGQTDAWAPSTSRQFWGKFLYGWRWVMTVAGWIVTALGAAAITGIIRRD